MLRRRKRGVEDYFKKAWNKIKSFFSRVFRGNKQPQAAPPDDRKAGSGEDEEEAG